MLNFRHDVEKKARQNPGWSDDGPSNPGGRILFDALNRILY